MPGSRRYRGNPYFQGRKGECIPDTGDPTYTAAEIQFMLAMEGYKTHYGRRFPTCCEVLKVLAGLGYRQEISSAGNKIEHVLTDTRDGVDVALPAGARRLHVRLEDSSGRLKKKRRGDTIVVEVYWAEEPMP